jgi:hypothetical protein
VARQEDLNFRVTATDQASKVIDPLAEKVEQLEDQPHEVEVTADAAKAVAEVKALDTRLDGLTGNDRVLVLKAQATQAQREIDDVTRKLARAHIYDDDEINLFIEARDNAKKKIDAVQAEIRSLDGDTATVTVEAKSDRAGIDEIATALGDLDGPIGAIGAKLSSLASPSGAIAGIVGGLILAADYAADVAIEADNLAGLTGDSVEKASQLNAVWKSTGADAKDFQDVLLQMNGVLATNAGMAKQLGIDLTDGATIGERFQEVSDILQHDFPDAAKRSQMASQLFGEEGVRQYNAMILAVGDLETAINDVPAVVSEEDVEKARETKAQIKEMKAEFQAFAQSLGSVVVPAIGAVFGGFNDLFDSAERAGQQLRSLWDSDARANFKLVEDFEDAELAAQNFDRQLIENATTFGEVRAKVLELTGSEHAANLVALEWKKAQDELDGSTKTLTGSNDLLLDVTKEIEDATRLATSETRKKERADADAEQAAEDHRREVEKLDRAFGDLKAELSDRSAYLGLQTSFDQVQTAAEEAFIAANKHKSISSRR